MTLPSIVRVFFAVPLPERIKDQLNPFISVLKKRSKTNAIRWTKPENLHITLQFLPEVRAQDLAMLLDEVRAQVKKATKNIEFKFGSLHVFPNPYRPRVIVLDLVPQEELVALSQLIGKGIQAAKYEIEDRPFRGHLTLGRIKQPKGVRLDFLSYLTLPDIEMIRVNEVILFRSEPQKEGSVYTPLERVEII